MKFIARTLLASSILLALSGSAAATTEHHAKPAFASSKFEQTGAALRDLWVGHVFWVRNVALETLANNPAGAAAAENEAVANARQIAAAMEPFYGKAASEKLFSLLAGHYGAVKQYLEATLADSSEKQDAARKAMSGNAEQLAVFLSGANPNLPLDGLRGMLLAHGGHHIQEIQQLRDKQYAEEAKTWDAMKGHMYGIGDALTLAIAKQFPAKFN